MRKAGLAVTNCVAVMWAISGGALAAVAQQSVTITTTSDFRRGNNEGQISPAQNRLTRDRITAGTVGAWTATTGLPSPLVFTSSAVHNGFIYIFGGLDFAVGPSSDVLVASINSDGTIGSWTSTTALPTARIFQYSVAYDGFMYVIGGLDDNGRLSDVLVAPINVDGTLGAWTSTTALPSEGFGHSSVAHNGFLYIIGGQDSNGVELNDVLVAPINANGTLGSWQATAALPFGRYFQYSSAHKGFLYVVGGHDGDNPVSEVLVAPVAGDGTLGTWTASTGLPSGRYAYGQSPSADNGFLYVVGGSDSADTALDEVLVAPINSDGTVGTWTATTALPSGRIAPSFAYGGYLYAIGGLAADEEVLTDVLLTPINPDTANSNQTPSRLLSVYSHLVDLQGDSSTRIITLNGQVSPGGVVRLQVRVAPDGTGVFGTETVVASAPLGSPIQVTGTGRYVWIRLTLDDTATSNVDQPTYISDITLSPIEPPAAGVVNDGLGADIDTQTSATTIEANWIGFTFSAGDSIAFYEWAIGTAPGLTNVQNWTSVGSATSATNSLLSLSVGVKYVSVRATGAAGLMSAVSTSDGVQVQAQPSPPSDGDDHKKKGLCGSGVSGGPGSLMALLGGIVLVASGFRRRFVR